MLKGDTNCKSEIQTSLLSYEINPTFSFLSAPKTADHQQRKLNWRWTYGSVHFVKILTTLSRNIQCEIVYWGMVSQSSDNNNVS